MSARLWLITYDVADPKRWRRIYKMLLRRGAWQQLSVFLCRLTPVAAAKLEADLAERIKPEADRLMMIDLGADVSTDRIRRHGPIAPLPIARLRLF